MDQFQRYKELRRQVEDHFEAISERLALGRSLVMRSMLAIASSKRILAEADRLLAPSAVKGGTRQGEAAPQHAWEAERTLK